VKGRVDLVDLVDFVDVMDVVDAHSLWISLRNAEDGHIGPEHRL
jgi:hypothetical protein